MTDLSAEANSLMKNPAFVHVLEAAQRDLVTQAMNCDGDDDAGRKFYLHMAKEVGKIANHLAALLVASKTEETANAADFYEERAKKRFLGIPIN